MGRAWMTSAGPATARRLGWLFCCFVLFQGCASSPPWMGMDGEQLYAYGQERFEARDWDEAIVAFERMVASFPGHPMGADARMQLARAHFAKKEYVSSAAEYERFLQRYPSHGMSPEASLGICRAYAELAPHPQRDQEYTRRAREACRATASEFRGMNVATEADSIRIEMVNRLAERRFQEGRFYQRRNFHDSAILVFQEVVDFFPETDWAPQALLALHRSYGMIGWEEEAEQTRQRLLFLYPNSEAAEEVRSGRDGDVD